MTAITTMIADVAPKPGSWTERECKQTVEAIATVGAMSCPHVRTADIVIALLPDDQDRRILCVHCMRLVTKTVSDKSASVACIRCKRRVPDCVLAIQPTASVTLDGGENDGEEQSLCVAFFICQDCWNTF